MTSKNHKDWKDEIRKLENDVNRKSNFNIIEQIKEQEKKKKEELARTKSLIDKHNSGCLSLLILPPLIYFLTLIS